MGLLERLKGYWTDDAGRTRTASVASCATAAPYGRPGTDDERALDRYRYLLRTAPPDAVEEVHAEAFARLTPHQRALVFGELSRNAAVADRPASDDPRTLARSATRSELRRPGFLERTLGAGVGAGQGLGTVLGGSLLGIVAAVVVGSTIAAMVLPGIGDLDPLDGGVGESDGGLGGADDVEAGR